MSNAKRAREQVSRASRLMFMGKTHEAIELLERANRTRPEEATACLLASAKEELGDYKGVLQALQRHIDTPDPEAITLALASISHTFLGNRERGAELARRALERRLREIEGILSASEALLVFAEPDTLIALGSAGLHREVLRLYDRLPAEEQVLNAYVAALAAFNLKDYDLARSLWVKATEGETDSYWFGWDTVVEMVKEGAIPPLELEYHPGPQTSDPVSDKAEASTSDHMGGLIGSCQAIMCSLAEIVSKRQPDRHDTLYSLIASAGEWGKDLGQRLLKSHRINAALKSTIISALLSKRYVNDESTLEVEHRGQNLHLKATLSATARDEPQYREEFAQICAAHEYGEELDTIDLLENITPPLDEFIPANFMVASLLLDIGAYDEAAVKLDYLENNLKQDPRLICLKRRLLGLNPKNERVNRESIGNYDDRVAQLTVSLKGIDPPVLRRIQIPERITLHRLHDVLQSLIGRSDGEHHRFELNDQRYSAEPSACEFDASRLLLGDALGFADRLDYVCGPEDNFSLSIVDDKVSLSDPDMEHAKCIEATRAFPPKDCRNLEDFASLLRNPELSPGFDAEASDIAETNERLSGLPPFRDQELDFFQKDAFYDPNVTIRPVEDKTLARKLKEMRCTLKTHKARALLFGAINATEIPRASDVMKSLWGPVKPVFESDEEANKLGANYMSIWNEMSPLGTQKRFRLSKITGVQHASDITAYAQVRKEEIEGFMRGLAIGSTHPNKLPLPSKEALDGVMRAGAAIMLYPTLSVKEGSMSAPHVLDTMRDLKRLDEALEENMNKFAAAQVASRREDIQALQKGKKTKRVGRNEPCPCGSGKKYKHCCGKI